MVVLSEQEIISLRLSGLMGRGPQMTEHRKLDQHSFTGK